MLNKKGNIIDYLVLVNKFNNLDDKYTFSNLICINGLIGNEITLETNDKYYAEEKAIKALLKMNKEIAKSGLSSIHIMSAYRSIEEQENIKEEVYKDKLEEGLSSELLDIIIDDLVAKPGFSEHHTGLSFDISDGTDDKVIDTRLYNWLKNNCHRYGFIIRYTDDKKDITGYLDEPWHIRYVGLPHSIIMKNNGLCLEEYLNITFQFRENIV